MIYFKTPALEELEYRTKLLKDPQTMSYNIGFSNHADGTIDFTKEHYSSWYERWINQDDHYYAYVYHDNTPIGEVALRYDEEFKAYMISIIVEYQYRQNHYGHDILALLLKYAFETLAISKVIDIFPKNRLAAYKLFQSFPFQFHSLKDNLVLVSLERKEYLSASDTK